MCAGCVWGSSIECIRWWGPATPLGLSLSIYIRPASLLAVVGRWTAAARRSSFLCSVAACRHLGVWSEEGVQAVGSVRDVPRTKIGAVELCDHSVLVGLLLAT